MHFIDNKNRVFADLSIYLFIYLPTYLLYRTRRQVRYIVVRTICSFVFLIISDFFDALLSSSLPISNDCGVPPSFKCLLSKINYIVCNKRCDNLQSC